MAFAGSLKPVKSTAATAYEAWLAALPAEDRVEVEGALANRAGWSNPELKARLEADPDSPAPAYGMTAFREWRATRGVQ